jgi:hypothetical protein
MKTGKKQAGYGVQSHSSLAEMEVAQPLSPDAKVHLSSNVTQHTNLCMILKTDCITSIICIIC